MTQTATPAPMHTSPDKVLLGRYHAREVIAVEIQRRRLDAKNAIAVAKKEIKKIQADQHPHEGEPEHDEWLRQIGRVTQKIRRLEAAKAQADEEMNKHINSRALPLFDAPPEDVALDCISGGIALLFEQGVDPEAIKEVLEREFEINRFRFAFENADAEVRDDLASGQSSLFTETEEDRGVLERRLAHMLGRNFPPPLPFTWLEIVAHLTDVELGAGWAWAAAPHRIDQPQIIVDVMKGQLERFEREPRLPAELRLTPEAAERLGKSLVLDIDDTGIVLLHQDDAPVQEMGKIDPAQATIPVFAAVRMLAAAANGHQTTRDDWTWETRGERQRLEVEGMSGIDNGGLNPETEEVEDEAPKKKASDLNKHEIVKALRRHAGNLTYAGQALGVHRDSLRRRCIALEIKWDSYRPAESTEHTATTNTQAPTTSLET